MTELIHPLSDKDLMKERLSNNPIAPPSPQLSQDDLMRDLAILDNKRVVINDPAGLLSPTVCQSPKTKTFHDGISFDNEDDIVYKMYIELIDLIYWRIPGRSGVVLGSVISSLILTRYYSLLYVSAAIFTIMTGFNLVFVTAYVVIQSIWSGLPVQASQHPYHIQIKHQRLHLISRDVLEYYYVQKLLDVMEVFTQKAMTIILVEDSKTTGIAFGISMFIYFVASYIPTKVFVGVFSVGLFTLPYYYDRYQEQVDERVLSFKARVDQYGILMHQKLKMAVNEYGILMHQRSKMAVNKYGTIVKRHSLSLFDRALVISDTVKQQLISKKSSTTSI